MDSSQAQRFTRMVEAYQKPLLNLCYIYLHDRALAEDAVQETFLKAYRSLSRFRGASGARTWLISIAINTCRDMRRSPWYRHVDRAAMPEDLPDNSETDDPLSIDIADAIMRLPDKSKEVILLYYFQEMTLSEIASIVGVTTSVVSRRIKKANKALYCALGKEYLNGS